MIDRDLLVAQGLYEPCARCDGRGYHVSFSGYPVTDPAARECHECWGLGIQRTPLGWAITQMVSIDVELAVARQVDSQLERREEVQRLESEV